MEKQGPIKASMFELWDLVDSVPSISTQVKDSLQAFSKHGACEHFGFADTCLVEKKTTKLIFDMMYEICTTQKKGDAIRIARLVCGWQMYGEHCIKNAGLTEMEEEMELPKFFNDFFSVLFDMEKHLTKPMDQVEHWYDMAVSLCISSCRPVERRAIQTNMDWISKVMKYGFKETFAQLRHHYIETAWSGESLAQFALETCSAVNISFASVILATVLNGQKTSAGSTSVLNTVLAQGASGLVTLSVLLYHLPVSKLKKFRVDGTQDSLMDVCAFWPCGDLYDQKDPYTQMMENLLIRVNSDGHDDWEVKLAIFIAKRGNQLPLVALVKEHHSCDFKADSCLTCTKIARSFLCGRTYNEVLTFWKECKPGLNVVRRACLSGFEECLFRSAILQSNRANTTEVKRTQEVVKLETAMETQTLLLETAVQKSKTETIECRRMNELSRRTIVSLRHEETRSKAKAKVDRHQAADELSKTVAALDKTKTKLQTAVTCIDDAANAADKKTSQQESKKDSLIVKLELRVAQMHEKEVVDARHVKELQDQMRVLAKDADRALLRLREQTHASARAKKTAIANQAASATVHQRQKTAFKTLQDSYTALKGNVYHNNPNANDDPPPAYATSRPKTVDVHVSAKGKHTKWTRMSPV
jgi:hypothetical protein